MADTYIVNHTLLGTGHVAGDKFPLSDDGKTVKDVQGNDVPVDLARLLDLFAIRKATDEEIAAFENKGTLNLDAVFQGDAPEGQRRVSSDTFAAVGQYQINAAGPNQSDVGAVKAEQASKAEQTAKAAKSSKADATPAQASEESPYTT